VKKLRLEENTLAHAEGQFGFTMIKHINENEFKVVIDKNGTEQNCVKYIKYERNRGRMVLPLIPSLNAVSVLETLGRSFAEVTRQDLTEYWLLDEDEENQSSNSTTSNIKKRRVKLIVHYPSGGHKWGTGTNGVRVKKIPAHSKNKNH
jgi:hypothetical protein